MGQHLRGWRAACRASSPSDQSRCSPCSTSSRPRDLEGFARGLAAWAREVRHCEARPTRAVGKPAHTAPRGHGAVCNLRGWRLSSTLRGVPNGTQSTEQGTVGPARRVSATRASSTRSCRATWSTSGWTPERRGHGRTAERRAVRPTRSWDDVIAFWRRWSADLLIWSGTAMGPRRALSSRCRAGPRRPVVLISGQFHHSGLLADLFGDDAAAGRGGSRRSPLAERYGQVSPDGHDPLRGRGGEGDPDGPDPAETSGRTPACRPGADPGGVGRRRRGGPRATTSPLFGDSRLGLAVVPGTSQS